MHGPTRPDEGSGDCVPCGCARVPAALATLPISWRIARGGGLGLAVAEGLNPRPGPCLSEPSRWKNSRRMSTRTRASAKPGPW